jgi:hypothetical protein
MHDHARAAAEYERAQAERKAYAAGLAQHPEWVRRPRARASARDTAEALDVAALA